MYPSVFFLMAYQVSSIVFTGQGKVGSENGRPSVAYQIAQRADFFETLMAEQTTYQRPLVNSRDEPLCGDANSLAWTQRQKGSLARLHVIFYDSTLCQHTTFLKVGVMQIILAMIEADCVHPDLLLRDPLDAVLCWSHDPDLRVRAELPSGQRLTAVDLQLLFLEQAKIFVDSGECECYVPEARKIIALWEDTLIKLKDRNFTALIPRLDWVLKRFLIKRSLEQSANLDWDSPQAKYMDLIYSSLDLHEGLYWALEQEGVVELLVSVQEIEHRMKEPPEDTRAWTRAMLLRAAGPSAVKAVNWDRIQIRSQHAPWAIDHTFELNNPLKFTKAECENCFVDDMDISELIKALDAAQCSNESNANQRAP